MLPQLVRFLRSSRGRTRTCDPLINSQLLYQLSYSGRVLKRAAISRPATAGVKRSVLSDLHAREVAPQLGGLGSLATVTIQYRLIIMTTRLPFWRTARFSTRE